MNPHGLLTTDSGKAVGALGSLAVQIHSAIHPSSSSLKGRWETLERDIRDNFFTQGVVHIWSELPKEATNADTVTNVKIYIWTDLDT